jgi:hypothetical protein
MPLLPPSDNDPRPEPPERPDDDACCRSGCDPCIFDEYYAAMERWRADLAAWEKRRSAAREEAGNETAGAGSGNAPAGR